MDNLQDTMIKRLWYVQYFEDREHNILEVQAASPDLLNTGDERIECLKRYASYMLPPGAEFPLSIRSREAPESLAFIRTEHDEHILVQKVYEDVSIESPYVNIYMLVGLPPEFSAREAIVFWQSLFWSHCRSRRDRLVEALSFSKLKRLYIDFISQFACATLTYRS